MKPRVTLFPCYQPSDFPAGILNRCDEGWYVIQGDASGASLAMHGTPSGRRTHQFSGFCS